MTEHKHKEKDKHTGPHKKARHVMVVVIGLLLLFSVVQAFQINALENKMQSGTSPVKVSAEGTSRPVAQAPPPAVPAMVGGC